MGNLAIIPARGGSKRIPKKNIKSFYGKPIVGYSIEAALKSELFEEVIVSTDSDEIAEVSRQFGAKTPFLRSQENSNDFAVLADVILEVLTQYRNHGKAYENVCCILPTAPFVSIKNLQSAYKKLETAHFDSVFPVLEFSFPIQRSLQMEQGKVSLVWKEHLNARSQDLLPRYHDAGQFYWCKTEVFLQQKKIFTDNSGAIIISELEAQDIDTETDWKLAELKYKMLHEIS